MSTDRMYSFVKIPGHEQQEGAIHEPWVGYQRNSANIRIGRARGPFHYGHMNNTRRIGNTKNIISNADTAVVGVLDWAHHA